MASGMSAIQATSAVAGAYSESEAIKAQGSYAKMTADANAHVARMKAQDAKERGVLATNQHLSKVDQMVSSQRAIQAANGIDINSGSAASVRSTTRMMGELDAQTIKNNAWREAWGYTTEANNQTSQGQFAELAASGQANNTLLTGGLRATGYASSAVEKWPTKNEPTSKGPTGISNMRRNGNAF